MIETIERPPVSGAPPLPPFLCKRGGGGKPKWVILPDILLCDQVSRIPDPKNNWWTLAYRWMVRLNTETWEGERAFVHTRCYRQWLETYETKEGLPPHISSAAPSKAARPTPRSTHGGWNMPRRRSVEADIC